MSPTKRSFLDYDLHKAGLPQIVDCDGCDTGIAERIVDDYCPLTGVSYQPVNGSSRDPQDPHCWLCASCSAAVAAQGAA
jgi:hypothetical protein